MLAQTHVNRSVSLSSTDRFFFPTEIKYIPFDGVCVILSPETANWLIVEVDDIHLVKRLVAGEKIGAIAAWARGQGHFAKLQALLAQIISREFAKTDAPPTYITDKSVKGAYFYLTNACNLCCSHCYMYSGKSAHGELSVDEWCALVDEFAQCGGTNITFSGGEILAKRGWLSVIERAHQQGISITMLTNGTLWDSQTIAKVAPWIAEVQISLDGPNEDINAITRGEGYFIKALEAAKMFEGHGARTSIAMTPTAKTIDLFESEFLDFFVKHINGSGINVRIGHKLLNGRAAQMLDKDAQARYGAITSRLANMIYSDSSTRTFVLGHKPNEIGPNCGFGGLSISSTGDIYPCNRVADVAALGNIRNTRLADMMPALDKAESNTDVDKLTPCKGCDLRYICGGGCRIDDFHLFDGNGRQVSFNKHKFNLPIKLEKINCTDKHRASLLKSMIDAHSYTFSGND